MKPDAILTSDIHLRDDQPPCRLDDFWEAQARKIKWLVKLQRKHECPILDAGDLYHKWRSSRFLTRWSILNLPEQITTLWGNHDTPYHNMELYQNSTLGILEASGTTRVMFGNNKDDFDFNGIMVTAFNYGDPPRSSERGLGEYRSVAIMHIMTYKGKSPWPGCEPPNAKELLAQMKDYDLVLTGHNHKPFVVREGKRLLVNPGSLTRQAADQIDHEPRVYLWYAKDNEVEPVYVPIEEGVISREHIDVEKEKDERLAAYITRMNTDFEIELSFEKNMEKYLAGNKVRKGTLEILREVANVR